MKAVLQMILFSLLACNNLLTALDLDAQRKQYLEYIFYFPNDEIIYFNTPKNASMTVRSIFFDTPLYYDYYSLTQEARNDSKNFLVVRSPYSRIISSYLEILKLRPDGPRHITKNSLFYQIRDEPVRSFKEFLLFISDGNFYETHCVPQRTFLSAKNVTLEDMNFIIDFDHLYEDLISFSNAFDIPIKENIHVNAGKPSIKKILEEAIQNDASLRTLIEVVYEDDFIFYADAMQQREEILKAIASSG